MAVNTRETITDGGIDMDISFQEGMSQEEKAQFVRELRELMSSGSNVRFEHFSHERQHQFDRLQRNSGRAAMGAYGAGKWIRQSEEAYENGDTEKLDNLMLTAQGTAKEAEMAAVWISETAKELDKGFEKGDTYITNDGKVSVTVLVHEDSVDLLSTRAGTGKYELNTITKEELTDLIDNGTFTFFAKLSDAEVDRIYNSYLDMQASVDEKVMIGTYINETENKGLTPLLKGQVFAEFDTGRTLTVISNNHMKSENTPVDVGITESLDEASWTEKYSQQELTDMINEGKLEHFNNVDDKTIGTKFNAPQPKAVAEAEKPYKRENSKKNDRADEIISLSNNRSDKAANEPAKSENIKKSGIDI